MIRTIYARRKGGSTRQVQVVDGLHRVRRSARSMHARGMSVAAIGRVLGIDPERVPRLVAGVEWWATPERMKHDAAPRSAGLWLQAAE